LLKTLKSITMFTGLVQDIGVVNAIDKSGDWVITIRSDLSACDLSLGASVCCSGCCLTVIDRSGDEFKVQVSEETLSLTPIRNWDVGTRINLEPSLKMGDALGGHFVFGHVDGLASVSQIKLENESHRITLKPPAELMPFIASKGSVALDGVSLTVNEVSTIDFGVNIIPHTWAHTTLGDKKVDEDINIEIDMLARYVARQMSMKEAA
jgi:riboflavin synthase